MSIVFTGRVFAVEVGRQRFPDGKDHDVTVVRHRPSVVLIPLRDDGTVVLVRQYRASIARMTWELPAGGIEVGETAEFAAARECEEETGVRPRTIERLRGLFPAPGFCDEELIFFRVSQFVPPPPDSPFKADDDEDIEVRAFPVSEARAMVERGEIIDLKTAYGLTLI